MKSWKQIRAITVTLFVAIVLAPQIVFAQYVSPSYKADETFIGAGGALDNSSTNYQYKGSVGDLGVGNTGSTNYQAYGGFTTTGTPYLEFIVNASTINLGTLSTSTAATGTGSFRVKAYLASGYVVRNASTPPKNGAYTMTGMPSAATSSPGTEQFGINLVANTSPATFGAAPSQVPDSTFGFGTAASGYNTANNFKYVNGDVIATSTKSSGETDFTISYLMNINSKTPGGTYVMNHVLVVTATY